MAREAKIFDVLFWEFGRKLGRPWQAPFANPIPTVRSVSLDRCATWKLHALIGAKLRILITDHKPTSQDISCYPWQIHVGIMTLPWLLGQTYNIFFGFSQCAGAEIRACASP